MLSSAKLYVEQTEFSMTEEEYENFADTIQQMARLSLARILIRIQSMDIFTSGEGLLTRNLLSEDGPKGIAGYDGSDLMQYVRLSVLLESQAEYQPTENFVVVVAEDQPGDEKDRRDEITDYIVNTIGEPFRPMLITPARADEAFIDAPTFQAQPVFVPDPQEPDAGFLWGSTFTKLTKAKPRKARRK